MRMLLEIGLSNALGAAVLALGVAALSRFCRRPALIFCLWCLVLVKFLTPPLVRLAIDPRDWLPAGVAAAHAGDAAQPVAPAWQVAPQWLAGAWVPLVAAVWAAGSAGWLALVLARLARFRCLLREAPLAASPWADEDVRKMQYRVAGSRHTFQFADLRFTGVHRLDPAQQPKAIDIALTSGRLSEELLQRPPANSVEADQGAGPAAACRGIYEVRGNMLKLCVAFGRARPDDFSSQPGSGRMLVVYRRAGRAQVSNLP